MGRRRKEKSEGVRKDDEFMNGWMERKRKKID
jgi:hypothetical protein